MNEMNGKGANALIAVVDFFSRVLSSEVQVGEEKQKQLDGLVGQLQRSSTAAVDIGEELQAARQQIAELRARVEDLAARLASATNAAIQCEQARVLMSNRFKGELDAANATIDELRTRIAELEKHPGG